MGTHSVTPNSWRLPLHEMAFWSITFFLIGVLLMSVLGSVSYPQLICAVITALFISLLILLGRRAHALLAVAIIIGAGYYTWRAVPATPVLTLGEPVVITGLVTDVLASVSSQRTDIDADGVHLRATLPRYPELRYGDQIRVEAVLEFSPAERAGYYQKEGVVALFSQPKSFTVVARNQGSKIMAWLYTIRSSVISQFNRVLPPAEATLLSGLTLGKNVGFSREFSEKLAITGTTHLVALSGYNISVIAGGILFVAGWFTGRRFALLIASVCVILFVVMTGAEASVVRAAIMAGIVFLAERSGRIPSIRNAVVVAAFVMVLHNPFILVFDVGFQLSFLALLGLVYLAPVVEGLFGHSERFSGLKKMFCATASAQLMVMPLLLATFGSVSFIGFITNVLLLGFIPVTMFLGLLIILFGLLSDYLALIIALLARVFLGYELGVINVFSQVPLLFTVERLPIFITILYYLGIVAFIWYRKRKTNHVSI